MNITLSCVLKVLWLSPILLLLERFLGYKAEPLLYSRGGGGWSILSVEDITSKSEKKNYIGL